jgi:general secretion pathway protein L
MLGEFFRWWATRLGEIAGGSGRSDPAAEGDAVLVRWNGIDDPAQAGVLGLQMRRRGKLRPMPARAGQAAGDRVPPKALTRAKIVLELPDTFLLERSVELPIATARDTEGAIGFEMDRLTPFQANEVVWSAEIMARDTARGVIVVKLSVVPRARIAPAVAALAQRGLVPAFLSVGGDTPRSLPFTAAGQATKRRRTSGVTGLAGLAALFAVVAIGLPFATQGLRDADLDRRIADLRPALAEIETLRGWAQAGSGSDVVAAERAQAGDPMSVLATLTSLLPDDTYLFEFAMTGRQVTLRGQSAGSARLIETLAKQPEITDPAFAAPVTRAENGKAELFSIRAQWRTTP